MTKSSSHWVLEYDVWSDSEWWYARRIPDITPEQRLHGVRRVVQAPTYEELKRECITQQVRAQYHQNPPGPRWQRPSTSAG